MGCEILLRLLSVLLVNSYISDMFHHDDILFSHLKSYVFFFSISTKQVVYMSLLEHVYLTTEKKKRTSLFVLNHSF